MPQLRLILCEPTAYWDVPLRRELAAQNVRLVPTRTWRECRREAETRPGAVVAIELTASNLAEVLSGIADLADAPHLAPVVALARRGHETWQTIAYEAGAEYFTTSPRELKPVAELIRRYVPARSEPEQGLEVRLWASLPWSEGISDFGLQIAD